MEQALPQSNPFNFITSSIRNQLILAFILFTLIPLIIYNVALANVAPNVLTEDAFESLSTAQILKVQQIEAFFEERKADARFLSNLSVVRGSDSVINEGMTTLVNNKSDQNSAAYQQAIRRASDMLFAFQEERDIYQDIMMVDRGGTILFATNADSMNTNVVATGELSTDFLARSLKEITIDDITFNRVHQELNQKVGIPIIDFNDNTIGILVLEYGADTIGAIMNERTGLGETGETYLVGQDNRFRNDSRFLDQFEAETTVLDSDFLVETTAAESALTGDTGTGLIDGYRGEKVLSVWSSITVQEPTALDPNGLIWALIAEIDASEVEQPISRFSTLFYGLTIVAILLVIPASILLTRYFTKPIEEMGEVFEQVSLGNLDSRMPVGRKDEMGQVGEGLNGLLNRLTNLLEKSEGERTTLQNSIMRLLTEVSDAADGDLTVQAEVSEDATGAIADSFNFMIEQLRSIIQNVQDASLQVSSAASEVQTTADHLAEGNELQAAQIVDTSAAIDEMTVSIQQVSENAVMSAAVGEQARTMAQKGNGAVQNTIAGMGRIRQQVQETSKRIKRLGESSQEIGEIVQLINDIADRTSILALNASIQAAMAGEQGRGFAVVAEEVERLADRSAEATKRISALVRAIQNETNEAVAAMEATTQEVVAGSSVANEAGVALVEIEGVSSQLAELIQSISLASKQQARGSETIARSMNTIADVTQQTAAGTKQAAVSIGNLAELAEGLRASVSTFKLSTNGHHA